MKILLLRSADGQAYVQPIGFPDEWDFETAREKAKAVITKVQEANPDEYQWDDDILNELKAVGFIEVDWNHGPYWDTSN